MVSRAADALTFSRTATRSSGAKGQSARSLVLFVLVGVQLLSIALAVTAAIEYGAAEALLCFAGAGALFVIMLPILVRGRYELFEPITFVILAVSVGVTLKAPYVVFGQDDQFVRDYVLLGQNPSFLFMPMLMVILGLAALSMGYLVRVPRFPLKRFQLTHRTEWNTGRLAPMIVVLGVIAAVSMFLYLGKMGIEIDSLTQLSAKRFLALADAEEGDHTHTSLGYYRWGASLVKTAFFVHLAYYLSHRKRLLSLAGITLVLLGPLAFASPVFNSSRTGTVMVLINAAIITHYLKRGLRVRLLVTLLAAALIGITVLTALRRSDRAGGETWNLVQWQLLVKETVGSRHFMDLAKTGHIIDGVPEPIGYRFGSTFFSWIAAPVPRTMWPGKPTLGSGPILGPMIFGTHNSGVPPGFVAELYMNFGVLGIPLGMFLIGFLLRFVFVTFHPHLNNPNWVLVYSFIVVALSFSLLSNDFSKVVIGIIKHTVTVTLALLFLTRKPKPAPASAI